MIFFVKDILESVEYVIDIIGYCWYCWLLISWVTIDIFCNIYLRLLLIVFAVNIICTCTCWYILQQISYVTVVDFFCHKYHKYMYLLIYFATDIIGYCWYMHLLLMITLVMSADIVITVNILCFSWYLYIWISC